MKKAVTGVVAALMLTMAVSGTVLASEGVEVEAGGKLSFSTIKFSGAGFSEKSDMAIMIGPAIEAKFANNVFAKGSIMTTATKYKIGDPSSEFSRTDLDLAVGYSFIPAAGAYVGFRNSQFSGDMKFTASGPMIGVRGTMPINDTFSAYGDLAYLMFTDEPDGGSSESAPGFGLELGVKHACAKNVKSGLGVLWEQTEGADTKDKRTISGLVLEVMYAF